MRRVRSFTEQRSSTDRLYRSSEGDIPAYIRIRPLDGTSLDNGTDAFKVGFNIYRRLR